MAYTKKKKWIRKHFKHWLKKIKLQRNVETFKMPPPPKKRIKLEGYSCNGIAILLKEDRAEKPNQQLVNGIKRWDVLSELGVKNSGKCSHDNCLKCRGSSPGRGS